MPVGSSVNPPHTSPSVANIGIVALPAGSRHASDGWQTGLVARTVREIAAAGPLAKSAIHYYFADVDVLIDRAMSQHVGNFAANLRTAASGAATPSAAFWSVIETYLATFREQPSS